MHQQQQQAPGTHPQLGLHASIQLRLLVLLQPLGAAVLVVRQPRHLRAQAQVRVGPANFLAWCWRLALMVGWRGQQTGAHAACLPAASLERTPLPPLPRPPLRPPATP